MEQRYWSEFINKKDWYQQASPSRLQMNEDQSHKQNIQSSQWSMQKR